MTFTSGMHRDLRANPALHYDADSRAEARLSRVQRVGNGKMRRAAVGRCPVKADQGRSKLHVWADTASRFCFRRCAAGDALRFGELAKGLSCRGPPSV